MIFEKGKKKTTKTNKHTKKTPNPQNFPGCQTVRWMSAAGSLGDLEEEGYAYPQS